MKRSSFPRRLLLSAAWSLAAGTFLFGCEFESSRARVPSVSRAERSRAERSREEAARARQRREREEELRARREPEKIDFEVESVEAPVVVHELDGAVETTNQTFRVQLNGQTFRLENGRLVLEGGSPGRASRPQFREVPQMNMDPFDAWVPIFQGVDRGKIHSESPQLMDGWAMRIDTKAEGIRFFATPPNRDHESGEAMGLKTSSFLRNYKCQVAVNANYFSPMWQEEHRPYDIKGLQVSQGVIVSKHSHSRPALTITEDNRAKVVDGSIDLDDVYTAISGDGWCLRDGEPAYRSDTHPRVAAGVSKDGRYVYLLTIDGRQRHSVGATKQDLGAWLKKLGAWNGINLDGGGTATMAMEDESGRAVVINRPIHNGQSGNERPTPSHLGVYAKRLK